MTDNISVGLEPVYGGGSGTLDPYPPIPILATDFNVTVNRGLEASPVVSSRIETQAVYTKLGISGTLTASIRPVMLRHLFTMLFGTCTEAGDRYTFTLGAPKSGEFRVNASGVAARFFGVGLVKMSLGFTATKLPTVSTEWIARDYQYVAPYDKEYDSEDPALPYMCTLTMTRGDGEYAVKYVKTNIKNFTLDLTRGLDGDYFVVDDYRLFALVCNEPCKISGSIDIGEDPSEIASVLYGDPAGVDLTGGNVPDDVHVTMEIVKANGSDKFTVDFDITYESLAVGNSQGSRKRTLKFKSIDDQVNIVVMK